MKLKETLNLGKTAFPMRGKMLICINVVKN